MFVRRRIPLTTTLLRRSTSQPLVISRFLSSSIPPSPPTLAILGGGLSGLSSAVHFLRNLTPEARRSVKVVVFEKESRVGGWCHAVRLVNNERVEDHESLLGVKDETLVFETGPRSIRPVGLQGWITIEMAHFLGLTPHLLTVPKTAPSARNRYLYTPPSLTLLPSSFSSVFRNLFQPNSLMRKVLPQLLLEPFRPRSKLHVSGHGDESIDSFFTRRFGKPLAEEMISAMIHGIYAGDSRKLSVRAVFPQLWEAEREFGSVVLAGLFGGFARRRGWKVKSQWRGNVEKEESEMERIKEGLRESGEQGRELVKAMEGASVWGVQGGLQEIAIRMKTWLEKEGVEFRLGEERGKIEELEQTEHGQWRIHTREGKVSASHLITTLPQLLPPSFSVPEFPSTTVSVINLSFPLTPDSPPLFPPGFGYLIPRTVSKTENPHRVLGVLFDSDVMPLVDTSSTQHLYKCSLILGGSYWLNNPNERPNTTSNPNHEELIEKAMETLRLHFPDKRFPDPVHAFTSIHRDCIPQVPVNGRNEILAFSRRLMSESKRNGTRVGVVGGGFAAVGVNGAVKASWEVGKGFAEEVNELFEGNDSEVEKGEKKLRKGVKKAVRTGMEMWEV
ncbi:oxygen-dependent protoporphyrinogen oxidase [Sporobolomyces salmoneus]|uniref:oxygen-dependent protoporphyrinogen oxidase n=1 Tax=Sporobolomyces salmoneus TaxID=183962 RepID=UPI003175DA1F